MFTNGAQSNSAPSLSPFQQAHASEVMSQFRKEDHSDVALLLHHCQAAAYVRSVMESLSTFPFFHEQREIAAILKMEEPSLTKWKTVGRIDQQSDALLSLWNYWIASLERLGAEYSAAVKTLWSGNYASYFQRYGIFEIQHFIGGRRIRSADRKSSDMLPFQELQRIEHALFRLHWYPHSGEAIDSRLERSLELYGSAAIVFHTLCRGNHNYDIF